MKRLKNPMLLLMLVAAWALSLAPASIFAQTIYEAESANLAGISVATSHTGYSGTGYVDGFDNSTDYITFTVDVPRASYYELSGRYSGPYGLKNQSLRINGARQIVCALTIQPTNNWVNATFGNFYLNAGVNTITVEVCDGWFQLDYITVGNGNMLTLSHGRMNLPAAANSANLGITSNIGWQVTEDQPWISANPTDGFGNGNVLISVAENTGGERIDTVTVSGEGLTRTVYITQAGKRFEAENAALTGVTRVNNSSTSGGAYVTGLDALTDKLVFTVNIGTPGSYPLIFRFRNPCGNCQKSQLIKVNDAPAVLTPFKSTNTAWTDKLYGNVMLNAGNNTIEIASSSGGTDFDYLTFGRGGEPYLDVASATIDASGAAQSLNEVIYSNVSWTISDDQPWISVSPVSGINTNVLTVSVTANPKSTPRSGTITVTGGGITKIIPVMQTRGYPRIPRPSVGTNFSRIDFANGWNDYFVPGIDWATVTNPWRSDFISELTPYSVLRFMEWGPTNGSEFVEWSSRIPKTGNNYKYDVPLADRNGVPESGAGVAYEWQIDLCKRAVADLWINIPHKASDDFVRQLARLIRNKLDTNLKVYVEYSNEVWNPDFFQKRYADNEGIARGLTGEFPYKENTVIIEPWLGYYVYRSCQVARIFEEEFAGQTFRLVKVLATELDYIQSRRFVATWGDLHPPTLEAIAALAQPAINPNGVVFDVLAVATYWRGNDLPGMTASLTGVESNLEIIQRTLNDHGDLLRLISYAGGQSGGSQVANAQNPGIYGVYTDALNRVIARLQGPLVHYAHVGWNAEYAWGAQPYTGASLSASHKYRAIVDWVNAHGGPPLLTQKRLTVSKELDDVASKTVTIYPNPVRSNLIIANVWSDRITNATISIYSSGLQKIIETRRVLQMGNNLIQIPAGQLVNGMHTLVINKGGETVVKKVVVQR